nr:FIST domain protein [Gemmatimonadaceae bacterium]
MTESAVVYSEARDRAAGLELGERVAAKFEGRLPDVLIVFASPANDVHALLEGLRERCPSKQLIGCTSAGEFVSGAAGEGASCAVALRSS